MSTKKLSVGGQAVIEGVMMRGPHKVAVAVRQPDGEIAVDVNPVNSIRDKYPILKKPLLRGVIASGNRNFGEAYGRAGDVIARKCGVPWLYRFELMGTQSDIENVRKGVTEFWQRQPQNA